MLIIPGSFQLQSSDKLNLLIKGYRGDKTFQREALGTCSTSGNPMAKLPQFQEGKADLQTFTLVP